MQEYQFDAKQCKEELVTWIRDWFKVNGDGCNAVIGISGGKDSTIAAALCVEALGKDRVIGVLMPDKTQPDIDDSYRVVKWLDIKYLTVNIGETTNAVYNTINEALKREDCKLSFEVTNQAKFNLPPRIRMSTLYAVSQCNNGRVVNTCNLSETLLGWETRWGDAVGDFSPFANLLVSEVVEIGKLLNVPFDLVVKAPADNLCGKTDEQQFGFTYALFDKYVRTGEIADQELKAIIDKRVKNNWFKHSPIPAFDYKLETKEF